MTLTEQLAAERRERNDAVNAEIRALSDPNRFRSDADRLRLSQSDTARIAAEQALNAAGMEQLAANAAVNSLVGEDWASTFWRDMQSSKMTPGARAALQRAFDAKAAVDKARERLQDATRAHNAAVREIGAAAAARRRAAKVEAGQLTPPLAEDARAARQAPTGRASRYNDPRQR